MNDSITVNWQKLLTRILLYFVVTLICVVILYPYFTMTVTALKSRAEIFSINGTVMPIEVKWSNFADIWEKAPMMRYMVNSFIMATTGTLIRLVFSVCAAYGLPHYDFKGKNFLFFLVLGTMMLPGDTLLKTLGIISTNVNWTPTPEAWFAWEIACGIFVTIPFVCFTVLSGLQSIDASYYEAATVDGANYWQNLFNVTLPLVKSSLTVATVLNIIYVFNSFPIIWTMTKGDPANKTDTLVTYLYKLAFYNGKQGEAAAVSLIGFVILLVCASVYMVSTLKKGEE